MERRSVLKGLGASALATMGRPWVCGAAPAPEEPPLLLSQVGYRPGDAKLATVRGAASGARYTVASAGGTRPTFRGTLDGTRVDPASGDTVQFAGLTLATRPGTWVLAVEGLPAESVVVGDDVYSPVLRTAMRGFYGQRCGCAVDLGGGYKHSPCHARGAYHATSGRSGEVANHGGWHDAGDYGRYAVNSGISTGTLLWAWELYPGALEGLALGIPESGGKLPDFLAEVRWNLDWMLSMQDSDGGVWHKQTSEQFCAFILPQEDALVSYVIGTGAAPFKSTAATADLAAVAAIAARCYRPYDAPYAERCLAAARRAWQWAMAHPAVTFTNPAGIGTGAYGDRDLSDELLWATAELWRTTGEPLYGQAFLAQAPARLDRHLVRATSGPVNLVDGKAVPGNRLAMPLAEPSWSDVGPLALWSYALSPHADSAVRAKIVEITTRSAVELAGRGHDSGYGQTLAEGDYIWGSNAVAANQSMLLLLAHRLEPTARFREAALGNLHYLLGRNCFGVSWLTGVGARPFQHPHHRPSAADGIAAPWPGLLSGGPNARGGDAVANLMPKRPPMRMWLDDQRAYSMNEIAINWNAPLVFLLAAACS